MNRTSIQILMPLLVLVVSASPVSAQFVEPDEAVRIAEDWVDLIVRSRGDWGGQVAPVVTEVEPLISEGRTVGYLCSVEPAGFVAVSAYRGLAPIRAHSETSGISATAEQGITGILKGKMLGIIRDRADGYRVPVTRKAAGAYHQHAGR